MNWELVELDTTCAESKVAYEEIMKYISDHHNGMKVSSLNIAQMKKEYGIEMGKNDNQPKSEDSLRVRKEKRKRLRKH